MLFFFLFSHVINFWTDTVIAPRVMPMTAEATLAVLPGLTMFLLAVVMAVRLLVTPVVSLPMVVIMATVDPEAAVVGEAMVVETKALIKAVVVCLAFYPVLWCSITRWSVNIN